jgi:hypothetical protein
VAWEHGTTTGYARKCRCDSCKAAHAAAAADYNARHPDKQKAHNQKVSRRRKIDRSFNPRQRRQRQEAANERRRKRMERPPDLS